MQANQINAILSGTRSVLENHLGMQVNAGKPTLQVNPVLSGQVSVIVGVTGSIKAELIMGMSTATVCAIIGKMYGGMEIVEIDDMGWSAFSEFGNWVGAACCTELTNSGYTDVNITPPIINEGESRFRSVNKFISIPFGIDNEYEIMVHISTPQ
ncbi:chemotaxis protein CheX [Aneurinibacillus soli]|uniref:CheY-P phosphatase CheX n=1 Tax=Aneurinibacillus soli TaxID=1500254 RepID=A0A0U5AYI0_9BACL|nr:chemotaxis protein CheX [Aneurinibacillus soli]PYE63132.1 chemotaxis protein CheX [Aneurinibacillus soli]BAU28810.1 CheY-P phosphatase CheX [Aneurinibacillus soli]